MELTVTTVLIAFTGAFLICFMKGAFGGGSSVIGIPLLSIVMDPVTAGGLLLGVERPRCREGPWPNNSSLRLSSRCALGAPREIRTFAAHKPSAAMRAGIASFALIFSAEAIHASRHQSLRFSWEAFLRSAGRRWNNWICPLVFAGVRFKWLFPFCSP